MKLCAQAVFATAKRTALGYLRRMRALERSSDQLNQVVRHTPLPQSHEGYGAEGAPLWRGEASPSPPPWQPSVRRFRKKVYRGFQGVDSWGGGGGSCSKDSEVGP
eukprot:CAMPEP_0182816726 /NCGR_PEP_ID=MMETSP0006_2-20121128/11090_1 /TAXON_ID=97485 /ORGANISM="Prymnesium parvum, Strain Texoma1" /LENGTH=104 /DNA_ID=CAMNT_0024943035 /DNA_START=219 /DNA_END=533 /DNA_ORIENTATION=+